MGKRADQNNLNFFKTFSLRKTRFTEFFILENALDDQGFKEWLFYPGMLFNATEKWWADQGRRDTPHVGLDLCVYRDRQDRIHSLNEKVKIPVMYGGIVVRTVDDFLGKTVIIEHSLSNSDKSRLYTFYGHINPYGDFQAGRTFEEGDIIATLADSKKSKANILPHLHISLGWASQAISYDKLDWETIGATNTLTLLDPLHVIDWSYMLSDCPFTPFHDLLQDADGKTRLR